MVLEVLEGEKTINEIASKYEVLPASLKQWKKQFLENMSLVFDRSTVIKEYKNIKALNRAIEKYMNFYNQRRLYSAEYFLASSRQVYYQG